VIAPDKIEHRPIASLRPYENNPRSHDQRQIRQIADSIGAFGFTNPILTDEADGVIAGHGRLAAARLLGMTTVPTIRLAHLSAAEKRAYILADNRLAELAGWDQDLLALELGAISQLDLDFDLTLTGFAQAEIDLLIEGAGHPDPAADTVPPFDPEQPSVSRIGDLWRLGSHRVLCGDAREPDAVATLMGDDMAQLVFTDPPYNAPIQGHVSGLGRHRHREFLMASGEMSEAEFTRFLAQSLGNLAAHSQVGAIHFICMDWRHLFPRLSAGREIYGEFKNLCVWSKGNGGMCTAKWAPFILSAWIGATCFPC